ncbi:MAG: helix-turn-helix domain-containing protein [Burkholderiaceae bacterium]
MRDNLKQLLLRKSDWFAGEIQQQISHSRYPGITPAQSRLLAHMGGKPMNMSELARRLAVSRQAVHRMVAELSSQNILEVREDPERGNAKLVVYTETGRAVNRAGAAMIDATEEKIARRIGADQLEQLKTLLAQDWD